MSRIHRILFTVRDLQLSLLYWLFVVLAAISYTDAQVFQGCDNAYQLTASYNTTLLSPYYPSNYPAGSSCRYRLFAPLNYNIQVTCTINLNQINNACSTEFFYVARDGDPLLQHSEQFCGSGTFVRTSLYRSLVLAYVSYGSWGQFNCSLYPIAVSYG